MKATIMHESRGRMRLKLDLERMTLDQADRLDAWLKQQSWADEVTVHERTCCVILKYHGDRSEPLRSIAEFSWQKAENESLVIVSTRKLDREYQEKLVGKVLKKAVFSCILPKPLKIFRICCHMVPFLRRGLHCLLHRQMKVELLDAMSVGISACQGQFSTAGMVIFLLEIGELLEEWTHKRAIEDLAQCMSLNVDRVWIRSADGQEVLVPIMQVQPGDHIVLRAGGLIPMDGVLVEGEAMVNQASLTGESVPVAKRLGGTLYAGTVIEEGECVLEVREANGDSRYDKIVAMIADSQQLKSEAETKAANLADKLVPYTFAGSLLGLVLTRNVARALSVLMVDFSCALKLAMPLAVLSAMREAGKKHITVKGGKYLELVAKADTIVLDKTGTLTNACPQVAEVIPFGGRDAEEMLRVAACLEEHFPHSLANAVVVEAQNRGLVHEEFHTKVDYLVAHGIASTVNGKQVLIGSAHFIFEDEHCTVPEGEQEKFDNLPLEYSHLYLAIGGELAAVICIADPLRDEAIDVLNALRFYGISNIVMLTGDNYRTAEVIAGKLGVDDFRAGVLPEGKASYIADLRAQGHTVIMVGDGINDSPALSEADVGIAISDGAALAREIADITIAADELWELVELRKIALGLMQRISSNYRFVIGFNGSLIALGLMGMIQPTMSATLHNLSTLAISMRSMTGLPEPKQEKKLLEA